MVNAQSSGRAALAMAGSTEAEWLGPGGATAEGWCGRSPRSPGVRGPRDINRKWCSCPLQRFCPSSSELQARKVLVFLFGPATQIPCFLSPLSFTVLKSLFALRDPWLPDLPQGVVPRRGSVHTRLGLNEPALMSRAPLFLLFLPLCTFRP